MVKYVDSGYRLPGVEHFLDKQQTEFVQAVYEKTGYPVGHELREIVESLGGEWNCFMIPQAYDTLNIPYEGGTLIIERPYINDNLKNGHRVSFDGDFYPDLEKDVNAYLTKLHQQERVKSKEFFLKYAGYVNGDAEEIAKLF